MDRQKGEERAAAAPATPRARLDLLPSMILLCILPFAHTVALRLTCLFLGCLVAAPALLREWRSLPCARPIALWAAVCLASIAWSARPDYSFGEFRNEVVYPLLAFSTFYAMTRGEAEWQAWQLSLAAGFLVAAGLAAYYFWSPLPWQKAGFLLGDANQLSTYLVLVAPVFAAFALQGRVAASRRPVPVIVGGALLIAAGWLTQNRTLWLALVAQTVVFVALYVWWAVPQRKVSVRGFVTVGVICAAMLGLFVLSSYNKSGAIPFDASGWEANLEQSVRPQIWRYAVGIWAERPLLGYGYGRGILSEEFTRSFGPLVSHTHNMFLNYAVETGAIGLVALGLLFASLARKFWGFLRAGDRESRIVGMAGLCLMVGALVKSTTDDPLFRENSLLLWGLLGMLLGRVRGK